MGEQTKILEIISSQTIESINHLSVVTPSIYSTLFFKFASEHDIDIADEVGIADSELSQKIALLNDLNSETSKNVQQLSDSTDKAIHAIQDKDETTLQQVLLETTHLKAEIEKLKISIYKDELTGIYNRKWLNDIFLEEEGRCFKESGTLVMVDLNYFKMVNDTFGHIVGDKVLIYIANYLKQVSENVIRYGGDEFILIVPKGSSQVSVIEKLNAVREEILSKKLKAQNTLFRISFSFGSTLFEQGDSLISVLEAADKNMYNDKIMIKQRVNGI